MSLSQQKRTVSRLWLMAELNSRLKRHRTLAGDACSARVRQILPADSPTEANWTAEFFDGVHPDESLAQAQDVVRELRGKIDVHW